MSTTTQTAPMVPLTAFTPMVLASLYSLPTVVAEAHLRNAAIEFARRTDALKRTVHVGFGTGQEHQLLALDAGDVCLHAVDDVHHPECGRKLTAVRCLDDLRCTPTSYYFEKPGDLWICPPLCVPGHVEVRATVVPALTACALDACLVEHVNTLAEYAVGMALNMPSASWYDPNGYTLRRRQFEERVAEIRTDTARGRMKGPLVAPARRFV